MLSMFQINKLQEVSNSVFMFLSLSVKQSLETNFSVAIII